MRKFLSSALVFVIILFSFTMYSNAANTAVSFTPVQSSVTVGSQFDVVFNIKSLGFSSKVGGVSAVLSYNSEYVDFVSITSKSEYGSPTHNKNNGKISILSDSGASTGPVFSVRFKLKKKVDSSVKIIKLSEINIVSLADDDITLPNPIEISISAKEPTPVNNTVNNTVVNNTVNNTVTNNTVNNTVVNNTVTNNTVVNNIVDNNTVNNTLDNTINNIIANNTTNNSNNNSIIIGGNTSTDNTISNNKIPYAGFNTIVIFLIVTLSASGIYAYYKYKKLNI